MLHVVEVGSFGGSSVGIMSNRQAWLSVHRSQPVIFRQAAGDGTVLRLELEVKQRHWPSLVPLAAG